MKLVRFAAVVCTLLLASHASASFIESFTDGDAASRWGVVIGASNGVVDDASADLDFDYSTLGLSNPNGSAETTGAYLQFNLTDQDGGSSVDASSAVIYPLGVTFSGPFVLELDMNVYYGGGSGSTEHAMVGILDPNDPIAPHRYATPGGPLAFAYSSDSGAGTAELHRYADGDAGASGFAFFDTYDNIPADSIPGFETGVAGSDGPSTGNWVDVRLESDGTTIDWYLNGTLVQSYDNTGGAYSEGAVLIGGTDLYSSVNDVSGVVIDNVEFTLVPEPSTIVLLGSFAIGALALVRRGS